MTHRSSSISYEVVHSSVLALYRVSSTRPPTRSSSSKLLNASGRSWCACGRSLHARFKSHPRAVGPAVGNEPVLETIPVGSAGMTPDDHEQKTSQGDTIANCHSAGPRTVSNHDEADLDNVEDGSIAKGLVDKGLELKDSERLGSAHDDAKGSNAPTSPVSPDGELDALSVDDAIYEGERGWIAGRDQPDDVTPPDENSCPDRDDHGCKHRTPVQELKQDASAQSDDASINVLEPHHGKAVAGPKKTPAAEKEQMSADVESTTMQGLAWFRNISKAQRKTRFDESGSRYYPWAGSHRHPRAEVR